MTDIAKRLEASVRLDAINGDAHERNVCKRQMVEAIGEINRLTDELTQERQAREKAEGDNAALLEALKAWCGVSVEADGAHRDAIDAAWAKVGTALDSEHPGAPLLAELAELREWKADIEAQHVRIIEEECSSDERHCTCVPALRRELARLRGVERVLTELDRRFGHFAPLYDPAITEGSPYAIMAEMAHIIHAAALTAPATPDAADTQAESKEEA